MSPGQIRELRADIAFILEVTQELADVMQRLRGRMFPDSPQEEFVMAIALNLARFYTALEDLLKRITDVFDEYKPQGPDWHAGLLRLSMVATEDRPAIIGRATYDCLEELKNFRHVVHKVYRKPLVWSRMVALVDGVEETLQQVRGDLQQFDSFLHTLLQS